MQMLWNMAERQGLVGSSALAAQPTASAFARLAGPTKESTPQELVDLTQEEALEAGCGEEHLKVSGRSCGCGAATSTCCSALPVELRPPARPRLSGSAISPTCSLPPRLVLPARRTPAEWQRRDQTTSGSRGPRPSRNGPPGAAAHKEGGGWKDCKVMHVSCR
jgi:hypothetical protein